MVRREKEREGANFIRCERSFYHHKIYLVYNYLVFSFDNYAIKLYIEIGLRLAYKDIYLLNFLSDCKS
jgi:hypothetical protein